MGKLTTRIKRLITGLLVLIMCLFTANWALFTHVHVLPDGSVVSHAHPVSKQTDNSGDNNHQHSSLEIFVLDQLNVLILGVSMIYALTAYTRPVTFPYLAEDLQLSPLSPFAPGRAPPACMY